MKLNLKNPCLALLLLVLITASVIVPSATAQEPAYTTVVQSGTTYIRNNFPILPQTDGYYVVPLSACGYTLTAGALAASTTVGNPGVARTAAGNDVLQVITTAAANTIQLDCDITPPSRLTSGRGVTLLNAQILFGYQTTALTSISGPVFNSLTYPATAGAAGVTVAAAGGSITVTAGTSHSTPGAVTTTGQCYSENAAFGTPIVVNTDLQRITLEETFAQSAAAATQMQVGGVIVHYQNVPL